MLIHAENDYSTAAGRALGAELDRLHKPHVLRIYPAVGLTNDDGHNMLYLNIPAWEGDVFGFMDEHVKRGQDAVPAGSRNGDLTQSSPPCTNRKRGNPPSLACVIENHHGNGRE
jgi:hypothetical protein